MCGHRSGTADDEFRSALCSVHLKPLSQIALHSRRVLEYEPPSSTAVTMLMWKLGKSHQCMLHATLLLYHVQAVASGNKWFDSCGTNGKLIFWTSHRGLKFSLQTQYSTKMMRILLSPLYEEQRSLVRFLCAKWHSPSEIQRDMRGVYGEDCMDRSNFSRWDDNSLKDVHYLEMFLWFI